MNYIIRRVCCMTLIFAALLVTFVNAQTPTVPAASSLMSDEEIRKILVKRVDQDHWGTGIVVGIITPEGRRIISYGKLDKDDPRPVDGDTVYEIGSVSKVFTSLILVDMIKRGEVALNDQVAKYLPTSAKTPQWQDHPITLVDLSTQTSGLPFFPTNLDAVDDPTTVARYKTEDLYRFLSSYELLHDIGVHWEYTNLGVGLLGLSLARRENTDYEGLLRQHITAPLGMTSTAITLSTSMKSRFATGHDNEAKPTGESIMPVFAGAGGIRSTVNDLLTFIGAFVGQIKSPLAAAMPIMLETRRPADDWLMYLGAEQALGWWVVGKGNSQIIAHAGNTLGFSSSIAYNPKTHVGVVALSNCTAGGNELAMHFLQSTYPLSEPSTATPKPHKEIAVDSGLFDRYAGKYEAGPNVIIVVDHRGDKLTFMSPSYPAVRLHAESETDFYIEHSPVSISFETDGKNRAPGILLHVPGLPPIPAKRVEPDPRKK